MSAERLTAPLLALAVACLVPLSVVLGVATVTYHGKAKTAGEALTALQGQVAGQNEAARSLLAVRTRERDVAQAKLDAAAADQEKKDAESLKEIARLDGDLRARPVRVRVVSSPCAAGGGGGGAPGDAAAGADAGAADAGQASGLLPESNSRRLASALTEVETLSAAYSSCRATLIKE